MSGYPDGFNFLTMPIGHEDVRAHLVTELAHLVAETEPGQKEDDPNHVLRRQRYSKSIDKTLAWLEMKLFSSYTGPFTAEPGRVVNQPTKKPTTKGYGKANANYFDINAANSVTGFRTVDFAIDEVENVAEAEAEDEDEDANYLSHSTNRMSKSKLSYDKWIEGVVCIPISFDIARADGVGTVRVFADTYARGCNWIARMFA
jgi:hypothetical protein